jgi:RNAse (barnase) inhibitor barstar
MTTPNVIDVSSVSTARALHTLLAHQLRFPDYYGHNWDAFWDCINDLVENQGANTLEISGLDALTRVLPREAKLFRECLVDIQRKYPAFKVQLKH